jgi:hypothetical protein
MRIKKYIVEKHGWQRYLAGSFLGFFGGKKIGVNPF